MKKAARIYLSAFSLLVGFSLTAINPKAATNVVLQGESLQQKIDAAAAGDLLVLQSGTYSGAISITKPLTLLRSGTDAVNIMNPVSVNTTGTVTFSQIKFLEEFVAQPGTNLDLRVYDSTFDKSMTIDNSKVILKRTSIAGDVGIRYSDVDALRLTVAGSFKVEGPSGGKSKVVMVQSKIANRVTVQDGALWFGYSGAQVLHLKRGEIVMVGADIYNTSDRFWHSIFYCSVVLEDCKYQILNSRIGWAGSSINAEVAGLALINSEGSVQNCDIAITGPGVQNVAARNAIGAIYSGGKGVMKNCFFELQSHGSCYGVTELSNGPLIDFRDSIARSGNWFTGGAAPFSAYSGAAPNSPINVRHEATPGVSVTFGPAVSIVLDADSKLKNAGSADPLDNNVDGTRNTIGSTGGPFYHPENKTTDRPIAFWLTTTPRRILKGADSTIKVDAAAASGH